MDTIQNPPTKPQAQAPAQTRTGKIARLPYLIREELNRRLDKGETAVTLLPWLNEDPCVQEALAERFDARPINAENLSHWRNGGFQDWLQHEENLDLAQSILDQSTNLSSITFAEDLVVGDDWANSPSRLSLSDRLSAIAALAIAKVIRNLSRGDLESPESQKALLNAVRTLNWLRQSDHRAIRLKMDLLPWEEAKAERRRDARRRASLDKVPSVPSVPSVPAPSSRASSTQPDPERIAAISREVEGATRPIPPGSPPTNLSDPGGVAAPSGLPGPSRSSDNPQPSLTPDDDDDDDDEYDPAIREAFYRFSRGDHTAFDFLAPPDESTPINPNQP